MCKSKGFWGNENVKYLKYLFATVALSITISPIGETSFQTAKGKKWTLHQIEHQMFIIMCMTTLFVNGYRAIMCKCPT